MRSNIWAFDGKNHFHRWGDQARFSVMKVAFERVPKTTALGQVAIPKCEYFSRIGRTYYRVPPTTVSDQPIQKLLLSRSV